MKTKQEELNELVIKTIRAWHGMNNVDENIEGTMWDIYNRNSPEMKRINELMAEIRQQSGFEFAEWCINGVVKLYYRDEKYNVLGTKLSFKSMDDLYDYWLNNVKNGK